MCYAILLSKAKWACKLEHNGKKISIKKAVHSNNVPPQSHIKPLFLFVDMTDLKLTSLRVICSGEDTMQDADITEHNDDNSNGYGILLCHEIDSEAEDPVTLHRVLDHLAKPIPIPSHKRRPVVKYDEGKKDVFVDLSNR